VRNTDDDLPPWYHDPESDESDDELERAINIAEERRNPWRT